MWIFVYFVCFQVEKDLDYYENVTPSIENSYTEEINLPYEITHM